MSRLTERELEEIRRVKRAVEDEAREEFSQVRLADDVDTRHPALAATLLAQVARISGLAEIAWMVRHEVVRFHVVTSERLRSEHKDFCDVTPYGKRIRGDSPGEARRRG